METTFNIPRYKTIAYLFNPQTGYFEKSPQQPEPFACNAMPFELKRERTMGKQICCNATECLTKKEIKKSNGSRTMFTGLQALHQPNWYTGDHLRITGGKKLKSDILFYFSSENDRMTAYYFSGFHSDTVILRQRFADRVIPHLQNGKG